MKKSTLLFSTFFIIQLSTYFLLSEFCNAQAPNWVWAKKSASGDIYPDCIATDANGNIYTTGYFQGGSATFGNFTISNAGGWDFFVEKCDPNGNVLWAKSAGSSGNDLSYGLATDANGNVYVIGGFESATLTIGNTTLVNAGATDIFFVKYDSNGNVLWARSAGGNTTDNGVGIVTDKDGNVFLTGYFISSSITFGSIILNGTTGNENMYIAKYDPSGNVLWAKSPASTGGGQDNGKGIATDSKGNVYVAGYTTCSTLSFGNDSIHSNGSFDAYTVKYDGTGIEKWSRSFGGAGQTVPSVIAVDTSGSAYLSGYFGATIPFGSSTLVAGGSYSYFLVKYDSIGNPKWGQSAGGVNDYGNGIAFDKNNNVFVDGFFYSDSISFGSYTLHNHSGSGDCLFLKYDPAGNVLWASNIGSSGNDNANGVAISGDNIYVNGFFNSTSIAFGSTTLSNASPGSGNGFIAKLSACGLGVTVSTVSSSCGSPTGTATANVSNGVPPYTYQWTNGDKSSLADTLSAGLYMVAVSDSRGCSTQTPATISDAGAPTLTVASVTNVSCHGGNNGSVLVSVSGGHPPYSYLWGNGATTQFILNVQAGPYQLEVTDSYGCKSMKSILVSEPSTFISLSVSTNSASCGNADGSATVTASGGNENYTYNWNTTPPQTSYNAVGLAANNYIVTVSDASGCSNSAPAVITNPNGAILAVDSIIPSGCSSGTGSIYVSLTGGTSPFTYEWSNGSSVIAATQNLIGAFPGAYGLTVYGSNSCKGTISAVVPSQSPFQPSICLVTVDTTTGTNQIIFEKDSIANLGISHYNIYRETSTSGVYQIVGNSPAHQLSQWTDPSANPQQQAWRYKISAVDTCGIESPISNLQKTIHLSVNLGLNSNVNLIWDNYEGFYYTTYCIWRHTLSTGWDSVAAVSGNPAITYNSYTDFPPSFTDLSYYIQVRNPAGCTPTVIHPKDPLINTTTVNTSKSNTFRTITTLTASVGATNASCNAVCNAIATATVIGGTAPYMYAWSPGGCTTSACSNLCGGGTYTVVVTDAGGHTKTGTVSIATNPAMTSSFTITNVSCNGGINGSATVAATGGNLPYSYLWNDSQTNQVATGLSAISYSVIITDAKGCTLSSSAVSISQPSALTTSMSVTDVSSCSASDGSATANPSGGTTPFSYLWSNGQTNATATNISSGTYTLTVTDANSCAKSTTVTLSQPTPLTVNIAPSSALICKGASVTLSAGFGYNSYSWTPGSQTTVTIIVSPTTIITYSATVSDVNGCTGAGSAIVTVKPVPATPNVFAGGSTTFCQGDSVSLFAPVGYASYLWSPTGQTTTSIEVYSSGNYKVTVSNVQGCTANSSQTPVIANPLPLVSLTLNPDTVCISSGTYALTGGTPGGGTYSGAGVSGGTFNPNSAGYGLHNLIYTYADANNCFSNDTARIFVDLCTGVNPFSSPNLLFEVYPNPSSGTFSMECNEKEYELIITNVLGEKILSKTVNTRQEIINLNEANGIYFLKVISENGTENKKIIISK